MSFAVVRGSNNKSLQTAKESVKSNSGVSKNLHNTNSTGSTHPWIYLQKAIGNQAVQKLTRSNSPYDFRNVEILSKLKVSQPGDAYEQEADRVAEQVTSLFTPNILASTINPQEEKEQISRKCSFCDIKKKEEEEGEKLTISRKPSTMTNSKANYEVTKEINNARSSGGSSLDASTKEFMESMFATYDFSNVRIHTNEMASKSAQSVNAFAYTIENDIVFDEGQYRPNTLEGRRLLAHELTHVIQQSLTTTPNTIQRQGRIPKPESPTGEAVTGSSPTLAPPSTSPASSSGMTTANPSSPAEEYINFRGVGLTPNPDQIYHELWPVFEQFGPAYVNHVVSDFEESIKFDRAIEDGTAFSKYGSEAFQRDEYLDQAAMRKRILSKERILPVLQTQVARILEEPSITAPDQETISRLAGMHPLYKALRDYNDVGTKKSRDFTREILEIELRDQGFQGPHRLEEFNKVVVGFEHFFKRYALQTAFSLLAENKKLAVAEYWRYLLSTPTVHDIPSHEVMGIIAKLKQLKILVDRIHAWEQAELVPGGVTDSDIMFYVGQDKVEKEQIKLELLETYPVLLDPKYSRYGADSLVELLALSPEELGRSLRGTAGEVYANVVEAQEDLENDPEHIWYADQAIQRAILSLGIQPDSIYQTIIDDKRKQIKGDKKLRDLFLIALGIAFGLMTLGSGAVAVAGNVGSLVVEVVDIASQVQEYKRAKAFAGSAFDRANSLSTEDPSLFWIAVQITDFIDDLGDAVRAFRTLSPLARAASSGTIIHGAVATGESSLQTLRKEGNAIQKGLGDRLEQRARKMVSDKEVLDATRLPSSELSPDLIQSELQIALRSPKRRIIDTPDYVEEIGLANSHTWRRTRDGRWCRFSDGPFCIVSKDPFGPTGAEVEAAARKESMAWWKTRGVTTITRFARTKQRFNSLAATLRNIRDKLLRQGRQGLLPAVNDDVLRMPVDEFIRRNPRLGPIWEQMEIDAIGNPGLRKEMDKFLEPGRLKGAGPGLVGNREFDIVEVFLDHGEVIVTDITTKVLSRVHIFKTDFYVEVIREMIGGQSGIRVFGLDINPLRLTEEIIH